jgi:ABC-type transport system substrate-binding protein
MMIGRTDRRGFLKTAGTGFAAALASPHFAWAADGDTLRLRVDSDLQVLDPFGLIGRVEKVINRCSLVSLIKLGDIREGNQWQPWGAEKLEWLDVTRLAFTLREGLVWSGDFGPVTTADVNYSFERFIGSESAWGYQFEKLKEVEVIDDRSGAMPPASVLIEAESTRYAWLSINKNAETLKDLKVRQAIQYAYDGDAVLQGAFNGLVKRSAGVIQPSTPFARKTNLIATGDVDKAKALLAEAGAEGITLNLMALTDSTSVTIAQIIQASLGEAGINVEIQPTEDAAYWAAGDKSAGDQYLSLELVLQSFAGGVDPTENLVWFRADQIGIYNWSVFDDPEFEVPYQASLSERDPAKRTAIFNKMEDMMEASGCFIFICFEPLIAIHRDTIKPVIIADGHPDPALFGKV